MPQLQAMHRTSWIAAVLCIAAATALSAQTTPTQQELQTRLQSQFLMLRGMWKGPKLVFDTQGNLAGTAEKNFFSLSAVVVQHVELGDAQLEIRGMRAGLDFSYPSATRDSVKAVRIDAVPYNDEVEIDIAREPQHPELLSTAIEHVFSIAIDEKLAGEAPFYWQSFLRQYLHPGQPDSESALASQMGLLRPGVGNPILRYAPDPFFSKVARAQRLSGVSVIGLVVDENGTPQRIHIVRPLGLGLDECAVATVLRYRFTPAMEHNHPVPAEVNIQVNFR